MAGSYQADDNYQPFSGIFDGDGHTLTLNVSNQSRFAAPFKCVSGATIKNLRTAGTINGGNNADGKLLAGIVGVSFGNTTITGCVSSVTLTTAFGWDAALAGLVAGTKGGSLTIEGCAFDGSMTGSSNTHCAGIAGYEYTATTTVIRNSLFAPTTLTVNTAENGFTKTISRDADATITNCYYTQTLGTAQGIGAISTTQAPQGIGNLLQDYGMVKAYAHGILVGGTYYFAPATITGTGTEGDPYIISNSDQWLTFVAWVNGAESLSAESFSGKYVRLTQDISISTPVGSHVSDSDNKPFSGTFLGDGHTITVTLTDDGKQGLAPFRYIDGATIKNLKVAGTIASSQYHSAGVVGFASGANTIEGCVVTATLNISSDYAGGIIGHGLTSATTIRGCAFTGTVNGVDGNRSNIGGLWGWSDNATPALENCLEAGTYTNIASMHPMGLQGGSGTITNCYYLNPQVGEPRNACTVSGTAQGTLAMRTATAPSGIGNEVQNYGMVMAYENGLLFGGKYYYATATSVGCFTEASPHIISSTDDWNDFVHNVGIGYNYSGKFVKLTNNISISTPVGSRVSDSDNKPFSGTFLGDGHTITAALAIDGKQGLAPFRCIDGATIRDLKVAGTIASNQNHTAGIAGFASGTNTIEDCLVTATLNISSDYAGGIIGHGLTSATTIRGCAFTGTVNGVDGNRSNIGGLWGWSDSGTPTLEGCLEAGTYTNIASMHPMGLQGGSGTITNCYYTT